MTPRHVDVGSRKSASFPPLENSVNSRWMSQQCAGGPGHEDEEDSKRTVSRVA